MDLNNKQIDSSINFDENLWLYKIVLPWIERYFESIYYSYNWNNKLYWKKCYKFEKIDLINKLVWISTFWEFYIICFIDLNSLESNYIFAKCFNISLVQIENQDYYLLFYQDFENKIKYISNYKWCNFSINLNNWKYNIKNNIFWTKIFEDTIWFDNKLDLNNYKETKDNQEYLDIADFFIYDDLFIKDNNSNFDTFYKFISHFNENKIKINEDLSFQLSIDKFKNDFYPKIKINIRIFTKNIEKIELKEIRQLLLSFFLENTFCYLIWDKYIKRHFSYYFNDFTNLDFNKLNLNFSLPENIFKSDSRLDKFKLDILKLRYNLFLLNEAKNENTNNILNKTNPYINLAKKRFEINKVGLDKNIKIYEDMFSKLLLIISNKFINR